MEVVTKVACCSVLAGGGGVTGAYGVYKISEAHDDDEKETKPEGAQSNGTPSVQAAGDTSGAVGSSSGTGGSGVGG